MTYHKLYIIIILLVIPFTLNAQYSFSSDYFEICDWIASKGEWSKNCEQYDASNLIVVNKDETVITITSPENKLTLYIQKTLDTEYESQVFWEVVTDEGENLSILFDLETNIIRLLDLQLQESRWQMIHFEVNNRWGFD